MTVQCDAYYRFHVKCHKSTFYSFYMNFVLQVKRKTVADALLELSLSDNTVENSIEGIPSEYCEPNIPENESNAASDHNTESVLQKGENNHKNSISLQTTLTMADIDALENVASYNLTKNRELHEKISNLELSEDSFKSNPDKVRVFTGLANFAILMTVFNLVSPQLKHHANTVLSPFQQLLVTLMRLRLNVPVQFLSYIFHVHYSTIVRTFANVIHVLHDKLVPLTLIWPDTEALRKTLPYVFKVTFPKCVSIIDCFEIFIERPSNLDSKAQTYSNYKSHNTVKYLISISPQGFVNFISKGRGGRTSDKQITEQSGYLNKLFPGDTVLADRGFTIQDSVGSYGASLEIPAFTRGKNQLEALEVIRTRNLASVRIHVERVIGNIRRKYPILDNKVPIKLLLSDETTTLTSLDKIVQVACGLTNICGSVVPFD